LSRVLADPGVPAQDLRILRDGGENYPAWLAAIRGARERIDFETFIVADDETGMIFAEALIERARAGVRVRFLYDWLGSAARASRGYWRALREAGVEVRVYGPLRPSRPHWFVRDHRKMLAVDGRLGFLSGLCVSDHWTGRKGVAPWRDTGVGFAGAAAVAALEGAFAETWAAAGGEPAPAAQPQEARRETSPSEIPAPAVVAPGDVTIRLARGRPGDRRLYRFDLLALAHAVRRAWITDSYFLPTRAYREALIDAARAGVDVRLLVPGTNDVPTLPAFVRTQYRELIEAGVRVHEWAGPMLHAKSAVFDGRVSRVGSTNLNAASWFGNYELDLVADDPDFAAAMEAMFIEDLAGATEIVLPDADGGPPLPRPARANEPAPHLARRFFGGRWRVGAASLGRVLIAAIGQRTPLSRLEAGSAATLAAMFAAVAVVVALWPGIIGFTLSVTAAWVSLALVIRLARLKPRARRDGLRLRAQSRRLLERFSGRR